MQGLVGCEGTTEANARNGHVENALAEPDLEAATRHAITFGGGMMGQMMTGAERDSMLSPMHDGQMHDGKMWFINGQAATGHMMDPLITLAHGQSHVLAMANDTAWHDPIHLQGHSSG